MRLTIRRLGSASVVLSLPRWRTLISLTTTIGSRGIAVLGGIALGLLLARESGGDGLGLFTYVQSWMVVLAIIVRFGTDQSLIRKIATLNATEGARYGFFFGAASAAIGALIAAIVAGVFLASDLAPLVGSRVASIARIQVIALPAIVVAYVFSGVLKGERLPTIAVVVEIGAVSGVTALVGWIAKLVWHAQLSVELLSWIFVLVWYANAVGVLLIVALLAYRRHGSAVFLSPPSDVLAVHDRLFAFYRNGWMFMLIALSVYATQAGSFVFAGTFLTQEQLGHLRAAERLALPIGFALTAIIPFTMPRIAAAYARGGLKAVAPIYRKALIVSILCAVPVAVVCIAAGPSLLDLFGPGFRQAYPYLVLMSLAQLSQAIFGVSTLVLTMTCYERTVMVYSVIILASAALLFPWLSRAFGPMGFSAAYLAIMLMKDLACVLSIWRLSTREKPN